VPEDPQLAGAPGDGGTPEAPPTFRTDFGSAVRFTPRSTPPNRIEYVRGPFLTLTRLVLVGDAERSAEDRVGPAFATEVASNESFGFGEYRFRVNLPACAAGEEAVSGLFVYQNGGDANGNGITDNSEIDIEVLCSEPHRLWLSVWTDYEEAEGGPRFRKHTRVVDARDGSYRESVSAERYELGPTAQPNAALRVPLFGQSGVFQELGFVWQPDLVRFFVVSAGRAVTLWELEGAEKIPTQPAQVMANLWHPAEHWSSGTAADYPAADLELELDSFAFWAALPAAP
jgi:hypothetical protein